MSIHERCRIFCRRGAIVSVVVPCGTTVSVEPVAES